jgi:hypothetical protein
MAMSGELLISSLQTLRLVATPKLKITLTKHQVNFNLLRYFSPSMGVKSVPLLEGMCLSSICLRPAADPGRSAHLRIADLILLRW